MSTLEINRVSGRFVVRGLIWAAASASLASDGNIFCGPDKISSSLTVYCFVVGILYGCRATQCPVYHAGRHEFRFCGRLWFKGAGHHALTWINWRPEGFRFETCARHYCHLSANPCCLDDRTLPHIRTVRWGFDQINDDVPTLPETLRANGFYTGILGKTSHVIPSRTEAFEYSRGSDEMMRGRSQERYAQFTAEFLKVAKRTGRPFFPHG